MEGKGRPRGEGEKGVVECKSNCKSKGQCGEIGAR